LYYFRENDNMRETILRRNIYLMFLTENTLKETPKVKRRRRDNYREEVFRKYIFLTWKYYEKGKGYYRKSSIDGESLGGIKI